MNTNDVKELYLGCECFDMEHVAGFIHFPNQKNDNDSPCIYLHLKTTNYFNHFLPPIFRFYDSYAWKSFFNYCWYRRIFIAIKYLSNPNYHHKYGILDCFDFQNKDLDKIDNFMTYVTENVENINNRFSYVFFDDEWRITISPDRSEFSETSKYPEYIGNWVLGWDVQFVPRNLIGRIKYAFKYIFNKNDQILYLELSKKQASKIRGIIKWIKERNKENE